MSNVTDRDSMVNRRLISEFRYKFAIFWYREKKNNKIAQIKWENHRKHSIFEYFLPDGFDMGSLARSISKARFISRIRVRSLSHAVFLYSTFAPHNEREWTHVREYLKIKKSWIEPISSLERERNALPFESSGDAFFMYAGDCNDDAICGFLDAIVEYVSDSAVKLHRM